MEKLTEYLLEEVFCSGCYKEVQKRDAYISNTETGLELG